MSLGPYRVGDYPATPIQIDVVTEEDLDGYTEATVTVWNPRNIAATSVNAVLDDGVIEFRFPEGSFEEVGVHWVSIVLRGGDYSLTLDSLPLVVEPTTSLWHTLTTARAEAKWAVDVPDHQLYNLLEVCRDEVLAFAPRLTLGQGVPLRYRAGQLMQARNRINAGAAAPGGDGGPDSFILSAVPLTYVVEQILRPKKGVPNVG